MIEATAGELGGDISRIGYRLTSFGVRRCRRVQFKTFDNYKLSNCVPWNHASWAPLPKVEKACAASQHMPSHPSRRVGREESLVGAPLLRDFARLVVQGDRAVARRWLDESEHRSDGIGDSVIRPLADSLTSQPIVLDKTDH